MILLLLQYSLWNKLGMLIIYSYILFFVDNECFKVGEFILSVFSKPQQVLYAAKLITLSPIKPLLCWITPRHSESHKDNAVN